MSEAEASATIAAEEKSKRRDRILNYSLRPAKNIERKMMGEVFARLSPLAPLAKYRYVGFGSEFFNDFSLYHETLGIGEMISIEHDVDRVSRCQFNRPYKCVEVVAGNASEILPKLKWDVRSIVWLDYVDKLKNSVLADINLLSAAACSGSLLVWTVNAEPWGGGPDEKGGKVVPKADQPAHRAKKLRDSVAPRLIPNEWLRDPVNQLALPLSKWGLASVYYKLILAEVARALSDRNASLRTADKLEFRQCFHFRYADGQRMLTVGGILLNSTDAKRLPEDPFDGLEFVRTSEDALELNPPVLTGREVRHLTKLLPHEGKLAEPPNWLGPEELERFKQVYRYYPVYAESEL